ncbi:copper resistance protein B [Acetobacter sp. AN02]|uniref:copper resistance protein B n=1 Tax=Acetobacter sp. AN02 TaxID=2894186 RepID=UPI0024345453|nr:copper resistance protein B [Acetobacter sp. AN02]MDG6095222.1 copper resistance protein B [Acetobacter sp. AN02]
MAQTTTATYGPGGPPVEDSRIYIHGIFNQLEGRYGPGGTDFRYDGEAWAGGDHNRVWLKSEGTVNPQGKFGDGQHELVYSRAISTYFNLQAGVRSDIDDGPSRTWGAFGLQGLGLYFFETQAMIYVRGDGNIAGKIEGSYDFLLTNRLILQPQAELNFYSKRDIGRGNGTGLSDIDTGLRLRYEIKRQFAPYLAVVYSGYAGNARPMARTRGDSTGDLKFTFGIRTWF